MLVAGVVLEGVEPEGAAAPPALAKALVAGPSAQRLPVSSTNASMYVFSAILILYTPTGSADGLARHLNAALRPWRADSPPRIEQIRNGSPVHRDLGRSGSALRGSIEAGSGEHPREAVPEFAAGRGGR